MESKNQKLLKEFSIFCEANPYQRFWQALRNWAKVDYVLIGGEEFTDHVDTFYFENKSN